MIKAQRGKAMIQAVVSDKPVGSNPQEVSRQGEGKEIRENFSGTLSALFNRTLD
ncbi:MAG: hypothetical protein RLZZ117_2306 [Cyanobacteriota bacterium]